MFVVVIFLKRDYWRSRLNEKGAVLSRLSRELPVGRVLKDSD